MLFKIMKKNNKNKKTSIKKFSSTLSIFKSLQAKYIKRVAINDLCFDLKDWGKAEFHYEANQVRNSDENIKFDLNMMC